MSEGVKMNVCEHCKLGILDNRNQCSNCARIKIVMFEYGWGGALLCDTELPGLTTKRDIRDGLYGTYPFWIAESMSEHTAMKIAELYCEKYKLEYEFRFENNKGNYASYLVGNEV